jgi:hypothetical protein
VIDIHRSIAIDGYTPPEGCAEIRVERLLPLGQKRSMRSENLNFSLAQGSKYKILPQQ